MRQLLIVLGLAACGDAEVTPDAMPVPADAPAGCTSPEELAEVTLVVSGSVTELATGAPLAGVTVDVARAWSARGFPGSDCPVLGTLTTDAAGRFGPASIAAGPGPGTVSTGQYLAFLVRGDGVADTVSDVRYSCRGACTLPDHAIAAPSRDRAASWRAELARGGMFDAATRGLVAFTFREGDGRPAAGVTVLAGTVVSPQPLTVAHELRFVDATGALAPTAQAVTLAPGLAVLVDDGAAGAGTYVAGERGDERWSATGSILADGWIFVEDKTVRPPAP